MSTVVIVEDGRVVKTYGNVYIVDMDSDIIPEASASAVVRHILEQDGHREDVDYDFAWDAVHSSVWKYVESVAPYFDNADPHVYLDNPEQWIEDYRELYEQYF